MRLLNFYDDTNNHSLYESGYTCRPDSRNTAQRDCHRLILVGWSAIRPTSYRYRAEFSVYHRHRYCSIKFSDPGTGTLATAFWNWGSKFDSAYWTSAT